MAAMHGWAAGRATERASPKEIAELQKLLDLALAAKDPGEFGPLSWDFHRNINILAHSPRLLRAMMLISRTGPQILPLTFPTEMEPTKKRYRVIMKAIAAGDAAKAESETRAFTLEVGRWILDLLGSAGTDELTAAHQEQFGP
jgi:DNA-binding FadR family transcriptional regulator